MRRYAANEFPIKYERIWRKDFLVTKIYNVIMNHDRVSVLKVSIPKDL